MNTGEEDIPLRKPPGSDGGRGDYAWCDLSLRLVGARCALLRLAHLSDVAILNRLRHSVTWVSTLVVQMWQRRRVYLIRLLLTTLRADPWPASLVLDLCCIRWQVKVLFKRLDLRTGEGEGVGG